MKFDKKYFDLPPFWNVLRYDLGVVCQYFVAIINICTMYEIQFPNYTNHNWVLVFIVRTDKKTYIKIFIFDPCSYFKVCLSRLKEQILEKGARIYSFFQEVFQEKSEKLGVCVSF